MTRDELAMKFALVLLRNPTMQDMAPIYFRERAYQYADAFLEEPEDDEEEPDDGEPAAPAPRRAWRVVPGPNAKLRHLTECPNRDAAIVALDRARARGDAEAVMERWEEGWVREESQPARASTTVTRDPLDSEDVDALHARYLELTDLVRGFREAAGVDAQLSDENAITYVRKLREAAAEELRRATAAVSPGLVGETAVASTAPRWRVQWRMCGGYHEELFEVRGEALFRLAGARRYDREAIFAFSTDGGVTWRVEVIGTLPEPSPRWRLLRLTRGQLDATQLGVFAAHAEALVAFSKAPRGDGDELVLEGTEDGGCTWVKLNAVPEGVTT